MQDLFNLLDKPWIPVLYKKGFIREVGLRELLLDSNKIREIAHDSPPFVVALLMLCVALLHSAWPGETTAQRQRVWQGYWDQGRFDTDFLQTYFTAKADRFNLFDPKFPFYQTAGMTMEKESPLFRLALDENNAGIFANEANPDWVEPPPKLGAQLVLCIQSYAVGLGLTSNAKLGDQLLETPRFTNGPLMSGLTIWPTGRTFFETLMLNVVPHELEPDDKPIWEEDEPYSLRDTESKATGRVVQPVRGICDLLTLQSRLIRLLPLEREGKQIVPTVFFTQGRSVGKGGFFSFHPFKLYSESKESGYLPLSIGEQKAIWRNSGSLFSKQKRELSPLNPLNFAARMEEKGCFKSDFRPSLDVVGIATKPGKAASILLWRHDRLPLPLNLLLDKDTEIRIGAAVEDANSLDREMRTRFAIVARALIVPERLGGQNADPEDVTKLVDKFDPRRSYWPCLETPFLQFLNALGNSNNYQAALQSWRDELGRTATECFRAACNLLGNSPNAVVAVAQVSMYFDVESILRRPSKS